MTRLTGSAEKGETMQVKDARLGNGSITYMREIEPRPETRETSRHGNVTTNIINQAIEGVPAHYEVTFMLNSTFETEGIQAHNVFHWNCVVVEKNERAPYRSIEDQAARQIAPMLRSLADRIESQMILENQEGQSSKN